MPNRIIKEAIRTSKDINNLSDFQFRVWAYLITYVDDYGRGSADPELLKGLVFPRRKGVTEKQISEALSVLANSGMISLYCVDGEPYFYFPTWEKHQQIRAKKSKFPSPEGICEQPIAGDSICDHMQANVTVIQSNPNPNTNPNTESNPNNRRFTPPTIKDVEAYCLERNNGIDAQAFIDFYTANGWVQGKGQKPIRDWKACIRTWEQHRRQDHAEQQDAAQVDKNKWAAWIRGEVE